MCTDVQRNRHASCRCVAASVRGAHGYLLQRVDALSLLDLSIAQDLRGLRCHVLLHPTNLLRLRCVSTRPKTPARWPRYAENTFKLSLFKRCVSIATSIIFHLYDLICYRNRYVAGECPWTQCIPIFQPVVPVAGLSIENNNRVLNNQMKQNAGFTETS